MSQIKSNFSEVESSGRDEVGKAEKAAKIEEEKSRKGKIKLDAAVNKQKVKVRKGKD